MSRDRVQQPWLEFPFGAVGHHHQSCTLDPGGRFAQPAMRHEVAVKGGSRGVDQDDVEITVKLPVLESVVEQQDVEGIGVHRESGCRGTSPIRPDQDRDVRHSRAILLGFIGTTRLSRAVSTQGDGGTQACRRE
ncbi:MAG: hypothetical protein VXX86_00565 [Planctomycetota bacterium]|nr:hypothetical protein [Planctomycetota bacterium]